MGSPASSPASPPRRARSPARRGRARPRAGGRSGRARRRARPDRLRPDRPAAGMREPGGLSRMLPDPAATRAAGAELAVAWARSAPALTVALEGELGAGKTTLVRGFLEA